MRSSGQDTSDDNHDGCENNGHFPAKVVAGQTGFNGEQWSPTEAAWKLASLYLPNNHLADDFSHKQRIRHTRADGRSILLGVLLFEEDIGHSPVVLEI